MAPQSIFAHLPVGFGSIDHQPTDTFEAWCERAGLVVAPEEILRVSLERATRAVNNIFEALSFEISFLRGRVGVLERVGEELKAQRDGVRRWLASGRRRSGG